MKALLPLFGIFLLTTNLGYAQFDNTPDWYLNTPQTENVLTVTAEGNGTSQALISALGQISMSVGSFVNLNKINSDVSIIESAIRWGNLFIYSKQTLTEIKSPENSFKFRSLTCLLPVGTDSQFEVCYTEEEKGEIYKTYLETIESGISFYEIESELLSLGVGIEYESVLTKGYVMLQIPNELLPDPMGYNEMRKFVESTID